MSALLLIAVTVGVLWPVCTFQFTAWGDRENITSNPLLQHLSAQNIKRIWLAPYMHEYVPLTQSLWAALAAAHRPLDARWFHSLNLALHVLSAVLVLLILHRLIHRRWAAWAGAAIFALHPIQVEAIGWASGTKTLLCGMLMLIATWQYIIAATSATKWRGISYTAAIAACGLAILANPLAVVTPLLIIAIDALILRRSAQHVVRDSAPLIFLAIAAATLMPSFHPASGEAFLFARPLIAADAIAFYLWKLIWPRQLGIDYGRTPEWIFSKNWGYLTWIAPVAMTTLIVALGKRAPALAAGGLIFLAGLLPFLGIVRFESPSTSTVANHYVYIAMFGVSLMIAQAAAWRRAASVIVVYALIACAAWSYRQTWHWQDSNDLFIQALDVNPQSGATFNTLALMKLEAREGDKALGYALKATQFTPRYVPAHLTLGRVQEFRNDRDEAIASYRKAVELEPKNVDALATLAAALGDAGSFDEAAELCRRAIDIDANSAIAHLTYANVLQNQQKWPDALQQIELSIDIDPYDAAAQTTFAQLLAVNGKIPDAISHYRAALQIDPDYKPAKEGLALLTSINPAAATTHSSP